ncbi:hypothetical protein E2562_037731 [Oryza meyeriana var. granulata]|uniref:Zinc finger PHD-type domain-containing protein n=1 Tax=Oryza meyeriana var. granulata TaxID=110450 RepID=A0A6G1C282_9ORYZ|nr:hypothetical protein E2562_037731 [Oryza meyeriana var. granulata]
MAVAAVAEEEEEDDGVLCAVMCGSTDDDPSHPIVFCNGCDLMVLASCYGNPLAQSIPDSDWFCSVCTAKASHPRGAKKNKQQATLLPLPGEGRRDEAHDGRALGTHSVFFRDPDGRDDVDGSRVPAHCYAMECYVCESSRGCALECSQPKSGLGLHVSCGLNAGIWIEYQEAKASGVVAGFCLEHTKLWKKQQASTTRL